jgi:polyhydroxyalkanoate synthesis regulator phasin
MNELTPLSVGIASAIGTGLVTLIYKIFEKVIDAKLQEWGLLREDKRKIADDIIAICADGQEKQYRQAPDNEKKIYVILNQLESMGSSILAEFVHFYNLWITTYTVSANGLESKETKEFIKELIKDTEKSRKILIKAVGIWKK